MPVGVSCHHGPWVVTCSQFMSILIISSEYYLEAGDKMGVYYVVMYSSFTAVEKQSPAAYKFNPFTAPARKFPG